MDRRKCLTQTADFAVLASHQPLPHGRELDIEIVVRQVKIWCDLLGRTAVIAELEMKCGGFIDPADAIERQNASEVLFRRMREIMLRDRLKEPSRNRRHRRAERRRIESQLRPPCRSKCQLPLSPLPYLDFFLRRRACEILQDRRTGARLPVSAIEQRQSLLFDAGAFLDFGTCCCIPQQVSGGHPASAVVRDHCTLKTNGVRCVRTLVFSERSQLGQIGPVSRF